MINEYLIIDMNIISKMEMMKNGKKYLEMVFKIKI